MTFSNVWVLSILSWGALAGLGYAGVLVTREETRQEKLTRRVTAVVAPHMRVQRIELSAFTPSEAGDRKTTLSRLASVFGFEPAKLDRYPLRWWLILMITFAVAKGAEMLAADVIGSYSLLVLPVLWVVLSRSVFGWFEKRFQDKLLHQFPDALAMIVRTVRVGIPVMRAIRNVSRDAPSPTRDVFGRLVNQITIGVALDKAVQEMAQRSGLPEYRFFATAITLQMQTGGALSDTLENLADVIRRRVALKARALALASEARTSAAVLAGLPFVSGTAIWALNPAYIEMLFNPGLGRELLSAAVLSLGCGLLVMRSLIPPEPVVTTSLILIGGAIFLVVVALAGMLLLRQLRQERLYLQRVALIYGELPSESDARPRRTLGDWATQAVTTLGQLILRSGLLPSRTLSDLERALASCGLHGPNGLGLFIGAKILLIIGLPIIALLAMDRIVVPANLHLALPAAAAVIGLLMPDWFVGKRHKQTMTKLEAGLPDALDMMVICAQAGLGLGPTIIRVGTELAHARPEIAREFLLTADDLQVISDSRVALGNLGSRTGVESIRRLVTALIQTMIYGTPLTEALRTLSAEMRQEVLTRFEARAARLPVLLTLPTVVFILPCVFLIVGGPAVIQVMRAFGGG